MLSKSLTEDVIINSGVASIAALQVDMIQGQTGSIWTRLRFSFPASHGGLYLNWRRPGGMRAGLTDVDWTWYQQNSADEEFRQGGIEPNGPQHVNYFTIPPSALGGVVNMDIKLQADHLFVTPALLSTYPLRLYIGLADPQGGPITLQKYSNVQYELMSLV